jgi:hypothetical protein
VANVPGLEDSGAERHRYVVEDSETHGIYEVKSGKPLTPQELTALIDSVIADEGRVAANRIRLVLV